ncbi:MAG: hypothetical protein L6R39_005966 [Caloplaca ligustica]|nr:MAG: hypothetical protein L6R39_005966 [Caloplaca ligustica]
MSTKPHVSHLGYSWGDFESREDIAEAELYEATSGSKKRNSFVSRIFNAESPLDQGDYIRSERKTARLASLTDDSSLYDSIPPTPHLKPIGSPRDYSNYHRNPELSNKLPPLRLNMSNPQDFWTAFLIDRRNLFQEEMVDLYQELSSTIDEIIDKRLSQGKGVQRTKKEDPNNDASTPPQPVPNRSDYTSGAQTSSAATPELSATEKYIQDWHHGGLILVENIPDQTPAREIYALFGQCGDLTYLELHGADKSKPHISVRHAYIHYAEIRQAHEARRLLHGFQMHSKRLMVFNLNSTVVRGVPGKAYVGAALEILNFNGGSNYAAAEADFFQVKDELEVAELPAPTKAATYSLKPQLTAKTAATSWRRASVPTDDSGTDTLAHEGTVGESADYPQDDEEVVFKGRKTWSRVGKLATVSDCDEDEDVDDEEDGGVYLPYEDTDDEEDFRLYAPVEPREFL